MTNAREEREEAILSYLHQKGIVNMKDFLWIPKEIAIIPTQEGREKLKALGEPALEFLKTTGLEIL